MTFNFVNPYVLLLLPAVLALTVFAYRKKAGPVPGRRRAVLGLRLTALFLLILCLSGFGIKTGTNEVTTIFVVDLSESIAREKDGINEAVKEALKGKKPEERVGIVAFGNNALVEMLPDKKVDFTSVQSRVEGGFTNIEQALRLASSLIPADTAKRIVLFSDGRENSGDALKQAAVLKSQGIALDVFPVIAGEADEVQLKEIRIPESLGLNENFEVVVRVVSTVKTKGTLRLYADRRLAAERKVDIQKGENNFVFVDKAAREGIITYTAVIDAEDDQNFKNNSLSAFSNVGDRPRVLIVQDENRGASELEKILRAAAGDGLGADMEIDVVMSDNAPKGVAELQRYDAFIISDVPADKLDDRFLNSLEICIRHQGKGLLVTGGENSYAPGGYFKTVLEKMLPVNMDVKQEKEDPNLGLVLVIDKSGSMGSGQYGVSKLELAKEAAIRSTEALRPEDMIGIIGFDDAVNWVVRTQKLTDLKKIQDAIGTMRPGGGTRILPPLVEAYESLKNADAKLKHIILLTDGEAEKSGYEAILEKMRAAGITLSTVAVGSEADAELLQALANGGNGRFYMTDEFSDIPKIFARETFLAGKTYLNNRTFTPNLRSYSEVLEGIDSVPELDGYVATTAKSTARVVFSSDRDEPVLATWQYGLGRTAAWTSDARGMWTSKWLRWEQSAVFWKNFVSWLIQRNIATDYTIRTGFEAGKGKLELVLPPEGRLADEKVTVLLVSPSGAEQQAELTPEAPGVYSGSFDTKEEGVYIANISITGSRNDTGPDMRSEDSGGITGGGSGSGNGNETRDSSEAGDTTVIKRIVTGITVPYSPEYDIPEEGSAEFIRQLAREAGGRVLDNPGDALKGDLPLTESLVDMTRPLIIAIILLFFLEIALRRVNIPADRVGRFVRKVLRHPGQRAEMTSQEGDSRQIRQNIQQETPNSEQDVPGSYIGTESADGVRPPEQKHESDLKQARISALQRVLKSGGTGMLKSEKAPDSEEKRAEKTGSRSDMKSGLYSTKDSTKKKSAGFTQEKNGTHIDRLLEKKRKRER